MPVSELRADIMRPSGLHFLQSIEPGESVRQVYDHYGELQCQLSMAVECCDIRLGACCRESVPGVLSVRKADAIRVR